MFIEASKEYVKNGNKNKLTSSNQKHILEVFNNRKEEQYFSCLVATSDVLANDANLAVSSYVEQEDTREVIDIKELNADLRTLISEYNQLNERIDTYVNELEG